MGSTISLGDGMVRLSTSFLVKSLDSLVGRPLTWLLSYRGSQEVPRLRRSARILVIRPGGIGDAVLLAPAISALRGAFPDSSVEVLAERRNAGVFDLISGVDRLFCYDRGVDLIRVLRRRYDVVIDTEQWHRLSAVVAVLTRAPVRVGFATNKRARLFTHQVPYRHDSYEVLNFIGLIEAITGRRIPFEEESPFVSVSPRYVDERQVYPTVVLFPGASVPERRWGNEQFGELAARLARHGCQVTVVGGSSEINQTREICSAGGPQIINLAGALSLKEVAQVLAGANTLVTADSGLMHVAYAVGTPTVALFGAGIREKWAPRGGKHRILSAGLPCSPCTKFGYTPPCPIDVECLRRISVDQVLAAALEVISQGQARSRQQPHNVVALPFKSAVAT